MPVLSLALKTLSQPTAYTDAGPAPPPALSYRHATASVATDAAYRAAVQPHLGRMSAAHVAQLGAFLVLCGPQPLPAEAVGPLQPLPTAPPLAAAIVGDVLSALTAPPPTVATSRADSVGSVGGEESAGVVASAVPAASPPPPLPASVQRLVAALRRRQARLQALIATLQGMAATDAQRDALEGLFLDAAEASPAATVAADAPEARQRSRRRAALQALLASGLPVAQLLRVAAHHVASGHAAPSGDAENDAENAAAGAAAEVQQVLADEVLHVLEGLQQAVGSSSNGSSAAAVSWTALMDGLQVVVTALGGPPPSPTLSLAPQGAEAGWEAPFFAAMVASRDVLWRQLQTFVASADPSAFGHPAIAAVLELQGSLASGRWPGWATPGGAEGAAAAAPHRDAVLFGRTMATLGPHFQGCGLAMADVASAEAAQQAFLAGLLPAAGRAAAPLRCLRQLLRATWQDGATWTDAREEAAAAAADPGRAASPLHACWAALLQALLAAGLWPDVLRYGGMQLPFSTSLLFH